MASLLTKAAITSGRDEVYVASMPLRAAKGPAQLVMSAAYSLNYWHLQHFMVILKPSSRTPLSQVLFLAILTWTLTFTYLILWVSFIELKFGKDVCFYFILFSKRQCSSCCGV